MVLGHSFVRRLHHYILQRSPILDVHFDLSEPLVTQWLGIGGRTVQKTIRYDMRAITVFRPDIVILQLGTNDLSNASPLRVGSDIEDFVRLLYHSCNVKIVCVCQTLLRDSDATFNSNVVALNQYLRVFLEHLPFALLWRHRGFWNAQRNVYLRDGVHLNDRGNSKLYRSFRGATQQSLRLLKEFTRVACE